MMAGEKSSQNHNFINLRLLKKLPCLVCCHVVGGSGESAECLCRDAAEARLANRDACTTPPTARRDAAPVDQRHRRKGRSY